MAATSRITLIVQEKFVVVQLASPLALKAKALAKGKHLAASNGTKY